MKKKNLLALSALVLSLGLTVSSCAGAQGEKGETGDKGDTGETGPQGPAGEPGQDGKTYIPVIVVNDDDIVGGTVTQDKYWVEAGKNETVTFTFTPDNTTDNLVIDFTINGAEVELSPDATEYTLTVDDSYGTVQVTSAEFTTALKYGENSLQEYYDSLVANDNQLSHTVKENGADVEFKGQGQWYDKTILELVNKEKETIKDALDALKDDATGAEQLSAVKTALSASETKIKEAYDDLVTIVKNKAKEELKKLERKVKSENFKDEDKEAILAEAEAAVDEATTIQGVTALVNNKSVSNTLELGSYDSLYADKQSAFEDVEKALEDVLKAQPNLDPENDRHENLVATLSTYGITVENLPTEVAQSYFDQISSARTLKKYEENSATGSEISYSKGDIVLAKEGEHAVTSCLDDIKETLVTNIRDQYNKEVDDSVAITSADSKTTFKGVINNAIDNWLVKDYEADVKGEDAPIEAFVDASDVNGLIQAIETAITSQNNQAFNNERIIKLAAEAKATLKEAADKEKADDADYAKAIDLTLMTSGTHSGQYRVANPTIGLEGYTVRNPLLTADPTVDNNVSYIPAANVETALSVDHHLNNVLFNKGMPVKQSGDSANPTTPLGIQQWTQEHLTDFVTIHNNAKVEYAKDQKAALSGLNTKIGFSYASSDASNNWEDSSNIDTLSDKWEEKYNSTAYDSTKPYTMVDVSSARRGFATSSGLLFTDDVNVIDTMKAFVRFIEATDVDYRDKVYKVNEAEANTSKVKKEYEATVDSILAGTATSDSVEAFANNINSYYLEDVTAYRNSAKEILTQAVQNKIANASLPVSEINGLNNRLNTALTALEGNGVSSKGSYYSSNTISGVDAWLNDANSYVIGATTATNADLGATYAGVGSLRTARVAQLKASTSGNGEWDAEAEKWATLTGTSIVLGADSIVVMRAEMIDELDLSGKYDATAKTLTYDLTTTEGINTWYADALTWKAYLEEWQYTRLNSVYEAVLALREAANSFVGTTIPTTGTGVLTIAGLNSDFKTLVDTWFGTGSLTTDLFKAGTDGKVALADGVDLNTVFSYGTFSGKVLQQMKVGEKTYNLFSMDDINTFFSDFVTALDGIDGIPA